MADEAARDPFLEQLTHAIAAHLSGPAPTAPTPPSFSGLPPLKAAAAAMNPQFAPTLINQQMAPAQAQYQQQQAAFEQAMAGRNQALQSATALAGAGIRADATTEAAGMRPSAANPRLQSKDFVITGSEAGKMGLDPSRGWKIRQNFNPFTGEYSQPEVLGEAFIPPMVTPGTFGGQEGVGVVGRSGQGRGSATIVPGAAPKANQEQVGKINDYNNLMTKIQTVTGNPLVAQTKTGLGEFAGRAGQQMVRSLPGVGPAISGRIDPGVENLNRDLDDIRARVQLVLSGKVVNEQEMKRLIALVPTAADATDPAIFGHNMQRLQTEVTATLRRQARLRPDLFTPDELAALGTSVPAHGGHAAAPASLSDEFDQWSKTNAPH